jgi:Na+/phosphate symporter
MRFSVAGTVVIVLLLTFPSAHASATKDALTEDQMLAQMESHAEAAAQREQCFLYTELVQIYTDMAGQQLADGEIDKANTTLKRVQHFADRIHAALAKDTKRVKEAEKAIHMASYHLDQYMHHVSKEDKTVAESTLKKLDSVHDELLAQVFAH